MRRQRGLGIPMSLEERLAFQDEFNSRIEMMAHMGMRLDLADPVAVVVWVEKVQGFHLGGFAGAPVLNGAAIAAIFDCAIVTAGIVQFPDKACATVDLSIKMMAPVADPPFRAVGIAIKKASRLVFAEAELLSGRDRICAIATGICAVSSKVYFGPPGHGPTSQT